MTKYGVNREELLKLLSLGICQTEDEALEKVASGQAAELIKTAEAKGDKTKTEEK